MGLFNMIAAPLIAASGTNEYLELLVVILEVAFGLGMVIFVHELGHFAVAKMCGVKCEKFYLGFDIYGWKICKFRYGETEYGIGILPLGGYVKMLGQDDNPARAAEERERSKLKVDSSATGAAPQAAAAPAPAESYALDPRSYMAQSVPRRMAIISAGVIMNLIFAFLMAMVAYGMGVRELASAVAATLPGGAAWQANLRPGDRIIKIGDAGTDGQQLWFTDLINAVTLADLEQGVHMTVIRKGETEPRQLTIKPVPRSKKRLAPSIGAINNYSTRLRDTAGDPPVYDDSAAARADKFQSSDTVLAIDGQPVEDYHDVLAQLVRNPDKTLVFSIQRKAGDKLQAGEKLDVEVKPQPLKTLGLVMGMGKVTAVQADSPAAKADIRPQDFISGIRAAQGDDLTLGDPMTLPERLRRRAGEMVTLTISRENSTGQSEPLEKQVVLRDVNWSEDRLAPGNPVSIPALGIAYKVLNFVEEVGEPAARALLTKNGEPAEPIQLKKGDEVVTAKIVLPKTGDAKKDKERAKALDEPINFSEEEPNWPFFISFLQQLPQGAKVILTLSDGRAAEIEPVDSQWFSADRGLVFEPEWTTIKAESIGEAARLAARKTRDSVFQVYYFLRKITTGQISAKGLGGPVTIAKMAGGEAYRGGSALLIFLTMLSANLAVINFLPIPLLDGGHMVFLALEGIFRKPVSEKVVVAFHYAGFLLIISLMIFVLSLDFGLISRHS